MPRLTDQEQQDILRYLEADKPLPDKYRFLLFDDKREVELVWNGKTSEVMQHRPALPDDRAGRRTAREKPARYGDVSSTVRRPRPADSRAGPTSSSGATTS